MKRIIDCFLLLVLMLSWGNSNAQNRNAIWCFGDSSGIDFNLPGGPAPISTILNTRGSCVSIADTSGQLLFYSAYDESVGIFGTDPVKIYSKNNAIMINGDSIKGGGWYMEQVITLSPQNDSLYYMFNIGVTFDYGIYYSVVDLRLNSGNGEVIQKNVQLESLKAVDCLSAIKHGNGRDWWVVVRFNAISTNQHHLFLVDPNGITMMPIQSIGSVNHTNSGRYTFSPDGSKLVYINLIGLMEIYDFDRCTGTISNPVTLHPEPTTAPYGRFWSCEFSASGRFLYVSTYIDTASRLFQYDLNSLDPVGTRDTLEYITNGLIGNGFLKRGPDNKIYFSHAWECQAFPSCYPYPDSVYNFVNMNLSVINYPDSLGSACNYTPYSFYLGGTRTHYGLPNNPDYDLPAHAGSPCDTLVSQNELAGAVAIGSLHVYYHPAWEKAFINASNLKGKTGKLLVYDMQGKVVHS
ncbi:MAG: hypothetical protein KBH11_15215, partial [Bacteroidia bacterium]|nr:hypothetical protein [Bacteroidia bacterium]